MYKKVLLPVGGDGHPENGIIALKKALEICDGTFIILHVTEAIPQTVGGEAREELEKENKAQGEEILAPVAEYLEHADKHFESCVEGGTPAETIVTVADREDVDLIVLSTQGRENLKEFLVGSITERVLRNTEKDLLAVRIKD